MRNLLFFPSGYPDEDFRSITYRYHLWAGNTEFKYTKKELFDIYSYKIGLFPRNLCYLLRKMPYNSNLTVNDILADTWFPLFKPFLNKEREADVINDIVEGKSSSNNYVGRVATQRNLPILSKSIRYCPLCIEEDYRTYGESYVHLNHQLAFVDFCHIHLVKLTDKCLECGNCLSDKNKGNLTIKPCCNEINYKKIEDDRSTKFKIRVIEEFYYLKEIGMSLNCNFIYNKMIVFLGEKGYIYNKGSINRLRLIDDLTKYFETQCPDLMLNINYTLFEKGNKQYFMSPNHMGKFILLYVLIIMYLAGSVENFLKSKGDYSIPIPFGNGPWPCNNKICPTFQIKKPIRNCKRKDITIGFKGKFKCPVCGFEYERKWMENCDVNQFTVKNKGDLWEKKVLELHNLGYTINVIAETLYSYNSSVQTFLKEYKKLTVIDKVSEEVLSGQLEIAATTLNNIEQTRDNYRQKIMKLKEQHGGINKTQARRLAKKEYIWLKQHDYRWLDKTLPKYKLDLLGIDLDLKDKIRLTSKSIYDLNPSYRIRKYTILKQLSPKNKNQYLTYSDKLPGAKTELEFWIESIEEYQLRKIPDLIKELRRMGRKKKITFRNICSIRTSYKNCTDEMKNKVEKVLNELQKGNY